MTSILCLAHYCDVHGPTPLMVTEGLPVPCGRCYDDNLELDRPQTSAAVTTSQQAVAESLRKMTLASSRSSSTPVSDHDAQVHRAAMLRTSPFATHNTTNTPSVTTSSPTTASAVQTPPQSPLKEPESLPETNKPGVRRDSSFRRTYDDNVTKRANPCQNCALTLPKRQDDKETKKSSAVASASSKSDQRGPTLRTRAPYARVYGGSGDASPPPSNPQSSCASDAEDDISPKDTIRPLSHSRPRPTTANSQSSVSSRSSLSHHTHYLDYTSTHEPLVPTIYSKVRASCLRTLSCETVYRRPEPSSSHSYQSPASPATPSFPSPPLAPSSGGGSSGNYSPGYISSAPFTPQSAAGAGGPIFFGDPLAGYTTAYIFRIPDVHARGRKRVYAFLALSTHRERLAMKTFNFVAAAFRDLASWIQELAEAEAEREMEGDEASPIAALNAAYGSGMGYGSGGGGGGSGLGLGGGGLSGASMGTNSSRETTTSAAPTMSSFLTSGPRGGGFMQRMGGSMGPGGFAPKARGLAELVGLPDFFIELHSRFVRLLLELGVVLGS